ncbi:MAG: SurA N-terminal domain-containing protein [Deltaproteobacteria bacterium]|nr:SurA N-terminal domain-containing protein [Deltaproteobacteria bacterium]MBW2151480.1 SurA N-terminal domain-containing protein [Deltaproteobacteria bacterium]
MKLFGYSLKCAICLIVLFSMIATHSQGVEYIDRIVAVVNDDVITLSELNFVFEPYARQIKARGYSPVQERRMLYKVRENMLNELIDQKLTDQEIKKAGVKVSEAEIDNMIERIKESRFLTDEELREALKKQGMTYEEYRKRMKEQILRTKLVNLEVKSKIVITQEDIQNYYEDHPELYGGKEVYHLRNILIKVPYGAEKPAAYQKMKMIYEKLKNGESFEKLARLYSESPVASDGGDLGSFDMDTLSPQIKAAIKELKAGEFTSILDTDQGYQIFYVEKIIRSEGKPIEQVTDDIRQKLFNEIVNKKFQSWLKDLRKRSHIKIIR